MVIYILTYILSDILMEVALKTKKRRIKILFEILSAIPFIFVIGFRDYSVGIDTHKNYVPYYEIAVNYRDKFDFFKFYSVVYSIGFTFIIYILSYFFTSPTVLLVFCAAAINFFVFKSIYSNSTSPRLSLFIYFFSGATLLQMNGTRSYLAMAIVLYSLKLVIERNIKLWFALNTIAALIHPFCCVFYILYPLYKIPLKRKELLVIMAAIPAAIVFGNHFLEFALRKTAFSNYFKAGGLFVNPLYTMLLINTIIFALFWINYNRSKNDPKYNFTLKLQTLSMMVCLMSFTMTQSYRVEQMVDFFQIITVPYNFYLMKINKRISNRTRKQYLMMYCAILIVYFIKVFCLSDDNQVRDYASILWS